MKNLVCVRGDSSATPQNDRVWGDSYSLCSWRRAVALARCTQNDRRETGDYSAVLLVLYSPMALDNWSGQEVLPLQRIPAKSPSISLMSLPSTRRAMPCKLPPQPPINRTLCNLLLSSTSKRICREQVPLVEYVNILRIPHLKLYYKGGG